MVWLPRVVRAVQSGQDLVLGAPGPERGEPLRAARRPKEHHSRDSRRKAWPLKEWVAPEEGPHGPPAFGFTLGTSTGPEFLKGAGHCFKRSGQAGCPLSCCALFCGQRVVKRPFPPPSRAWQASHPGHWEEPWVLWPWRLLAVRGGAEICLPEESYRWGFLNMDSELQFGCEMFIRNPVLGEEEGSRAG